MTLARRRLRNAWLPTTSAVAGPAFKSAVVSAQLRTDVGTQDFTVSGFGVPKAVLVFGCYSSADHIVYSVGASDGISQWCNMADAQDTEPNTDSHSGLFTNRIALQGDVNNGVDTEVSFDSFITNGVRLNVDATIGGNHRVVVILLGGTDLTAKAGTSALATDTNAVTVTSGFQTNALIVANPQAAAGTIRVQGFKNMGLASYDGSTILQCCIGNNSIDASPTGNPATLVDNDKILAASGGAWTVALGNITDTQFDLTTAGADLSGHTIGYLALNLPGLNAWAGVVDSPLTTGDHSFAGIGFRPSLGIVIPTMLTAVDSSAVDDTAGTQGLSAIDGNSDWCWCWTDEDAAANMNTATVISNKAIDLNTDDQLAAFDAVFSSWDADGMTLNFTAAPGTARKWPALFLGV